MKNIYSPHKNNQSFAEKRKERLTEKRKKKNIKASGLDNTPTEKDLISLLKLYESGRISETEQLALALIQKFPRHPFAWKVLGALCSRIGKLSMSLTAYQKSIELAPKDPESHSNLGIILQQLAKLEEAEASCRYAILLDNRHVEAHNNLGAILYSQNKLEESEQILRRAITLKPDYAKAHNNLGMTLQEMEKFDGAIASYNQAIKLNVRYAEPHSNLGDTFRLLGKLEQAEASYRESLILNPNFPLALNNLGNLLEEQGRQNEAESSYVRAIALDPQLISTHKNLALLYTSNKQYDKARDCFKKALVIDPNFADIKFGLAMHYLRLKDFSAGFKLYEARYHPKITETRVIKPNITIPQYHGTNLFHDIKGKHLLICPEQGVGDEVMFASLLPELSSLVRQYPSTRITLACDPRLVDLFNHSFNFLTAVPRPKDNSYQTIEKGLDYWLFIGSLPKLFRTKIEDFSNHQPYLLPNNKLIDVWRSRFDRLPHKTNIGISWKGGSGKKASKVSLSLEKMLPILSKASLSANIINLQYGDHQQEIEEFQENTGITIFDWDDCDPLKDLSNFSAQIKALDLVISIDTATVEFCGAIGTNTYVLLPFNQDWRWGEDNSESYWHPNILTSYRQTKNGDWDSVIQTVANIL